MVFLILINLRPQKLLYHGKQLIFIIELIELNYLPEEMIIGKIIPIIIIFDDEKMIEKTINGEWILW
jgi:hypothetical protein